jgi:hypothetical protein
MYRVLRSLLVALGLMVFAAGYGWASDVDIPNTFTSGTTAVAAEVNANFNAVKEAVDDNDARITTNTGDISDLQAQLTGLLPTVNMDSYKPQSGLVKTMTYTYFTGPGVADEVYDITVSWNGVTNVEEWAWENGNNYKFFYVQDAQGLLWEESEIYDSGTTTTTTEELDPPLLSIMASGDRAIGVSWGGASVITSTRQTVPPTIYLGATCRMQTILGIEDVTVPAGTFENCVKIYQNYISDRVYWLAPGFGWIKRVADGSLWELESYGFQ